MDLHELITKCNNCVVTSFAYPDLHELITNATNSRLHAVNAHLAYSRTLHTRVHYIRLRICQQLRIKTVRLPGFDRWILLHGH